MVFKLSYHKKKLAKGLKFVLRNANKKKNTVFFSKHHSIHMITSNSIYNNP